MSDLKDILPQDSETVQAIYAHWKQRGDSEPKRGYLGGSAIGTECERQLWYAFRECSEPQFEGRLYRLFNRGHREEPVFVDELKAIGCQVHEVGPDGEQFEVVAFGGHFKGHADGVALGIPEAPQTWHLLEMKTSNTKDFNAIKKHGVEKHKPVHFAQMQVYMHLLKLDRALYMVVCKETDELYTERVKRDPKKAQAIIDKAERIIFANTPPTRISEKSDFYLCKFCDAQELCHGLGDVGVPVPKLSCRQCCHATPEQDGSWSCKAGETFGKPCDKHLFVPGLVNFAEPTDAFKNDDGSQVIEFTCKDGSILHHGSNGDAGQYNSHNLMTMPIDLLTTPRGESIEKPDGVVQPNLEYKWATDCDGIESAWRGKVDDLNDAWNRLFEFPMSNPIFEQEGEGWTAADFRQACVIVYGHGKSAEIRIDKNQK